MRVTATRGAIAECLQALRANPADVVLLGDNPTDHDHLVENVRTFHANHSKVGLILLIDSYDRNFVVNAMRAGARGLFCRACQPFRALLSLHRCRASGSVLGKH
jgi:DNA-binding NarL/FixJ family response regulator